MGRDAGGEGGDARAAQSTVRTLLGGGRGMTLAFLAIGWLFINGFRIVLPALLPGIKADFAIGNASAGFALTVLWLLYATMQFPGGILADRTGERPLLAAGASLGALSLAAFFVAPGYALFLLACAMFGLGAGLFGTPRDMLLTRTYAGADNTAYGVTFAAGSIGAAALPYVGTAIAARFDWRIGIVWILPPLLLVGVALWFVVPTRPPGMKRESSTRETVALVREALTKPRVLYASAVMLLFVFTYQGFISFLPTYLVEAKGLSPANAALLFGALFVVGATFQPLTGSIADRYDERWTLLALIGLATVTLAALPFVNSFVGLVLLVPIMGIRIAIGPLVSAYIVRILPGPVQGTGWGLLRTIFFGLGATGSTAIGLFGDAGLFDVGFLFFAGLSAVMGICWYFIPAREARG